MSTIKIKQVKSRIGAPADQKRTLDALGLRKLNRVVEHESVKIVKESSVSRQSLMGPIL